MAVKPKSSRFWIPAAIAGGAGTFVGYGVSRLGTVPAATLADALVKQTALSAAGPIIATGMTAGAVLLSSVIIPLVVVLALKHEEDNES